MVKECGRRWSEIVGAGRMEGIVGGEVVRPNMDMACAPRPYTLPLLSHTTTLTLPPSSTPHPPSFSAPTAAQQGRLTGRLAPVTVRALSLSPSPLTAKKGEREYSALV